MLDDDGPDGSTERRIPADRLRPGQRFVVWPGERIAADGTVLVGQSAIDRSMMTGESVPVDAAPGDAVTGGTIALTGRLVVHADQGRHGHPAGAPDRDGGTGQAGKAGLQRLADRICAVFVPSVLACSVLTLAGWLLAGSNAGHAVSAALAVLIIACPCAPGLATPAALVVASGRGARMGIFIKGYQALESSRAIDTVVLDKTGTVTTGQMTVTAVLAVPGVSRGDLLRYAGSVEQASEHAVAAAITALTRAGEAPLATADGFEALPGLGARGVVDGREVVVGRTRLFTPDRDRLGAVEAITGRVTKVVPAGPCLRCQGVIDDGKLAAERDGQPLGYTGAARVPDPAVVTLNGIVASAAATEVLQQLTGFAGTSSPNCGWIYDGLVGTLERAAKAYRGCDACRYERGLGDV